MFSSFPFVTQFVIHNFVHFNSLIHLLIFLIVFANLFNRYLSNIYELISTLPDYVYVYVICQLKFLLQMNKKFNFF